MVALFAPTEAVAVFTLTVRVLLFEAERGIDRQPTGVFTDAPTGIRCDSERLGGWIGGTLSCGEGQAARADVERRRRRSKRECDVDCAGQSATSHGDRAGVGANDGRGRVHGDGEGAVI